MFAILWPCPFHISSMMPNDHKHKRMVRKQERALPPCQTKISNKTTHMSQKFCLMCCGRIFFQVTWRSCISSHERHKDKEYNANSACCITNLLQFPRIFICVTTLKQNSHGWHKQKQFHSMTDYEKSTVFYN